MIKRIISILLAVIITVGAVPILSVRGSEYDKDGDGEAFVLEVQSKSIKATDREFTLDINIVENTGVYAVKFYLVYDKALTVGEGSDSFEKGEAFDSFTPETDVGLRNSSHSFMTDKDPDYLPSLEKAGYEADSDMLVTTVYSECEAVNEWSDDTGRLCTVNFAIDPEAYEDSYSVYVILTVGNFIREDYDDPNADEYGIVEIFDIVGIAGTVTVLNNLPEISVSDAQIVQGEEKADFTLSIENNFGIHTLLGYIGYDERMSLTDLANGDVFENGELVTDPTVNDGDRDVSASDNEVIKAVFEANGLVSEGVSASRICFENSKAEKNTKNGTLITFSLDTKELTTGVYDICFCYANAVPLSLSEQITEFRIVHGVLTVAECSHEYSAPFVKAPTCTEPGYTLYSCTKCSYSYKTDYSDALGHSWNEGQETKASTCSENGEWTRICETCGEAQLTQLPRLSHIRSEPVTELIDGIAYTVIRCTVCSATVSKNPVNSRYDKDGDGEVFVLSVSSEEILTIDKDVTVDLSIVENTGVYAMKFYLVYDSALSVGDASDSFEKGEAFESFDPDTDVGLTNAAHSFMLEKDPDYRASLEQAGLNVSSDTLVTTVYSECELLSEWSSDTGRLCSVTFTIDPDNKKDAYNVYIVLTVGNFIREDAEHPASDEYGIVEIMDIVGIHGVVNAVECTHDYIKSEDSIDATCTDNGISVYICSVCGDTYSETTNALGHSYSIETVEPTCTETGAVIYTCTTCGDTYSETTNALGHSYSIETVEPTCTETGFTRYTCSVCGSTYTDDIKAALGHRELLVNYIAPDCTENGYSGDTVCTVCNAELERGEEISALGHTYRSEIIPPTCTEDGYTKGVCDKCGKTVITETYDALGHVLEETVKSQPTCISDGEKQIACQRCDYSYTEAVAMYGHEYACEIIRPTTASHGYTQYTCIRCADSYKDSYTLPVFDESSPNITVSQESLEAGTQVTVKLTINNNPGISSFRLKLIYDTSKLQLEQASVDGLGGVLVLGDTLEWTADADSYYSGECIYLTFTVLSVRPGVIPVRIDYAPEDIKNANGENVAFGIQVGSVKIYPDELIKGDLDGNGRATITDVLLMRKYIAGIIGDAELYAESADLDGNGRVTITDVLRLRKYIAGIIDL